MSDHAEARGSGGRIEEDPVEAANNYFSYLDEHLLGVQGDSGNNNPDTDTNTGIDTPGSTGTKTAPETGEVPKGKRERKPNKVEIGKIVVTAMHPKKLETMVPEEAR